MSLNIESLRVFCDVIRQKSFSKAAAANDVSQSAASQMVSQLEKRLGVKLIDRSKRPLAPTLEGQLYFEGCRKLIEGYFQLEATIQSSHEAVQSSVHVASIYSVGLYDMSQYVRAFQELFPRGQVRIQYLHPDKVYELVLSGEADLGLVSFPRPSRELERFPWREEPMVLVCPPGHRLAGAPSVALEQIDGENYVAFDSDLMIRREMDRWLRRRRVHVKVVMEFDNIEAIKRGIEVGAGVALLPEPTIEAERDRGSLAVVRLEGEPLARPLGVIHRRGRKLSPAMVSFIDFLK